MKTSTLLLIAFITSTLLNATALPALAQNNAMSGETEAPGQPFVHPSDDASYAKDMRDDERLAKASPEDNGKVRYISGGIADSGMKAIDAEENNYNLKMLFVSKDKGAYLANVGVTITDSKGGTLLQATTKGPVLLAKIPPGKYTVTAKASGGSSLNRMIDVGNDHLSSYVLRYPASEQ
jgi:hypothetical protein